MKFRSLILQFFFGLLLFSLFLGGLELLLRTTHLFGARISWSVPDPEIGWRFVPGGSFWHFKENDHPIIWQTNSHGWKDREWTVDKPAGTYRVAVLGDSFVESMQVEQDKNFLSLAEKEWNEARSPKIEIMNFGRSGFTQTEELMVLKSDVLRFKPDAVVLYFFPSNDIYDIHEKTAVDVIQPFYKVTEAGGLELRTDFKSSTAYKLKSLIAPLKNRSALVSLLSDRMTLYRDMARMKKLGAGPSEKLPAYLTLGSPRPDAATVENYALNKRLITEIAFVCRENGIRFILAVIDTPAYLPEVEARFKEAEPGFDPYFFEKDLKALADSLGAGFIGLQTVFRNEWQEKGKELHWQVRYGGNPRETAHWNYEGHQAAARALNSALEKSATS